MGGQQTETVHGSLTRRLTLALPGMPRGALAQSPVSPGLVLSTLTGRLAPPAWAAGPAGLGLRQTESRSWGSREGAGNPEGGSAPGRTTVTGPRGGEGERAGPGGGRTGASAFFEGTRV